MTCLPSFHVATATNTLGDLFEPIRADCPRSPVSAHFFPDGIAVPSQVVSPLMSIFPLITPLLITVTHLLIG